MKNKQGCVDWLVEEINKQKAWADPSKLEPIIEQAKGMHKEEILIAYSKALPITDGVFTAIDKAHDYYNETFGETKN